MNKDRDNGPNLNTIRIRIPALRPQLRWMTRSTTGYTMASQKTLHATRLSELSSTLANLRVYSTHMGVDMQLANQQLCHSLTSAALQMEDRYQDPPVVSDQTRLDQVLRKRKFPYSSASTLSVGDATEVEDAKRRKAHNLTGITGVSGGLNKGNPGIAAPQWSGLGETISSQLANGRMNISPHARISHRQVTESQPVERTSPIAGRDLLAWQPEPVPKTSTGPGASTWPKGLQKSLDCQNHVCLPHLASHVRGPHFSRGQVLRTAAGMARLLPWPNNKICACTVPVGPNCSRMHLNKIELIRMYNEISTCIFLCERGKASVREEEKLLKILDEVMTISPRLTLQMLADAKLGAAVRRLLADNRYGPRVKGKARTIMDTWKRSFCPDRRRVKSRSRAHKSDQSMDPQ